MLLAQTETITRVVDKATTSAADYGFIGYLFLLLLVAVGLALWMMGRFLVKRDALERKSRNEYAEAERESRERQQDEFVKQLRESRDLFEKLLREQREQGHDLAKAGQMSILGLTEAFHELAFAISIITGTDQRSMTLAALRRHREERKDRSKKEVDGE